MATKDKSVIEGRGNTRRVPYPGTGDGVSAGADVGFDQVARADYDRSGAISANHDAGPSYDSNSGYGTWSSNNSSSNHGAGPSHGSSSVHSASPSHASNPGFGANTRHSASSGIKIRPSHGKSSNSGTNSGANISPSHYKSSGNGISLNHGRSPENGTSPNHDKSPGNGVSSSHSTSSGVIIRPGQGKRGDIGPNPRVRSGIYLSSSFDANSGPGVSLGNGSSNDYGTDSNRDISSSHIARSDFGSDHINQSDADGGEGPGVRTGVGSESLAGVGVGVGSGTRAGAGTGEGAGTRAGVGAGAGTRAGAGTGEGVGTRAGAGGSSGASAGAGTRARTGTGAKVGVGLGVKLILMAVMIIAASITLFYALSDNGILNSGIGVGSVAGANVGARSSRTVAGAGAKLDLSAEGVLSGEILSLSYEQGEGTEFCIYKNYIVKCTRDSLYMINRDGEELLKKNIEFQNPALTIGGNYLLAYDLGGRSAFVIEDRSIKWEDKTASNIISASINEEGYMTVVTEAVGFRSSVSVIAPFGRKLFDWVVADDYVIDAQFSRDSKQVMINRIKTSGISVKSAIEFIDIKAEPFAAIESEEEKVFLRAVFLEDNYISVATETDFRLYNSEREIVTQEAFDTVYALCEFPEGNGAVAAKLRGENVVNIYGPKGQSSVLLKTEAPIQNMGSIGGSLFVNTGQQVIIIGSNGKVRKNIYFETDVLYSCMYEKSHILVVTDRRAELYRVD